MAGKDQRLPKVVVFDLDDTIWYPELYMIDGAPFRKDKSGRVYDRSGEELVIYPDAMECLKMLAGMENGPEICYASRTHQGNWARSALALFDVDKKRNLNLLNICSYIIIQTGSKTSHFRKLQQQSGAEFSEMLFFDNERWNITEVSSLGVASIYTPNGFKKKHWEEGLMQWHHSHHSMH